LRRLIATLFALVTFNVAGGALATPAQAEHAYRGSIDGEFTGWEGETVYRLIDGHVIQQAEFYYYYHYVYSPRVVIYRSGSGYKIHVEGVRDRDVRIRILR
jgi:hypothetical protein